MLRKKSTKSRIGVVIIIVLFVFGGVSTYSNSKREEKFRKYSLTIQPEINKLDKYAFGDYEVKYESLLDKSDTMIRTEQTNKINKMKVAFINLDATVESNAPQSLEGYYNELNNLDTSKLDQTNLAQVNKDIGYVRILIDKKFYRIAYNEYNRIKSKVSSLTEAKIKEEQAAAESERNKALEANLNAANATGTPIDNNSSNTQ